MFLQRHCKFYRRGALSWRKSKNAAGQAGEYNEALHYLLNLVVCG